MGDRRTVCHSHPFLEARAQRAWDRYRIHVHTCTTCVAAGRHLAEYDDLCSVGRALSDRWGAAEYRAQAAAAQQFFASIGAAT